MGCGSSRDASDQSKIHEPPLNGNVKPVTNGVTNSSSVTQSTNGKTGAFKSGTDVDERNVALGFNDYPPPKPPPTLKSECFNLQDFKEIDARAEQAPANIADSYKSLVDYLTVNCTSDMEKLRSVFKWIGSQNIDQTNYSSAKPETPKSYMQSIQKGQGNYAAFFTAVCRAAGLPSVIVPGIAKSVAYEVGDKNLGHLRNRWNAVYVDGAWRLVHSLWAFRSVVGFNTGAWTLVETEGKQINQKQESSLGKPVRSVNEFYFLTDPEQFVSNCFPEDPEWQLLKEPLTIDQYESVPYCKQTYFELDLKIISTYKCILDSEYGVCEIEIAAPEALITKGYKMEYELFRRDSATDDVSSHQTVQLDRYVFMNLKNNHFIVEVRFPNTGTYKISLYSLNSLGSSRWVCDFRMDCGEAQENCQPLPDQPAIGWGPGPEARKIGLQALSHTDGLIIIRKKQNVKVTFKSERSLEIRAELIHNTISKETLKDHLILNVDPDHVSLDVTVPEDGEYALKIFAKERNSKQDFVNVCNYLLRQPEDPKQTKNRENARARNIRIMLLKALERDDIDQLEYAIDLFTSNNLKNLGDLTRATDRVEYLKLRKDLRDCILRRHLGTQEKAIAVATKSQHAESLGVLIRRAEKVKTELKRLNQFRHEILDMKQWTISEIHSYTHPQPVVHHIMLATFLLLGESMEMIEDWENVQALVGKSGKQALKRRVEEFDITKVTPAMTAKPREYMRDYTADDVRIVSSGAASFFVWVENVIYEIDNRANINVSKIDDAATPDKFEMTTDSVPEASHAE